MGNLNKECLIFDKMIKTIILAFLFVFTVSLLCSNYLLLLNIRVEHITITFSFYYYRLEKKF